MRVEARHITYDLLGNVVVSDYAPENVAANTVVEEPIVPPLQRAQLQRAPPERAGDWRIHWEKIFVECLLDPDEGVVPQDGARLVRDISTYGFCRQRARDRRDHPPRKNMLGATLTTDADSIVTRIVPEGQDADGNPLRLNAPYYVDSPRINDYPVIMAANVKYDVKVGEEGIGNVAQAQAKLTELAQADFSENGVDMPEVGLDVDFVALGETEEYKKYADLQAVHLYDTVRVIAKRAGIDAAIRMTGYTWDAIGKKYNDVTWGRSPTSKRLYTAMKSARAALPAGKLRPARSVDAVARIGGASCAHRHSGHRPTGGQQHHGDLGLH